MAGGAMLGIYRCTARYFRAVARIGARIVAR